MTLPDDPITLYLIAGAVAVIGLIILRKLLHILIFVVIIGVVVMVVHGVQKDAAERDAPQSVQQVLDDLKK